MKILVFSDSHKKVDNMKLVLDKIGKDISAVLHLGDITSDAQWIIDNYPGIVVEYVSGNCDYFSRFENSSPDTRIVTFSEKNIFMSHGHTLGVKANYYRIQQLAADSKVDVFLFGHTHAPAMFEENGILFLNPGSISFSRCNYRESYAVIDICDDGINKGKISANVVEILPKGFRIIT